MPRLLSLGEVRDALRSVLGWGGVPHEDLRRSLSEHKARALAETKEGAAKEIWCLEQVLAVQRLYLGAFESLRAERYYEAWCSLDRVEISLHFLAPHAQHLMGREDLYRLQFIREHTARLQSLYPYKVFISPEIIESEKKCSTCGQVVAIRRPCGHRVGEIYAGEMCIRIVSKSKIVGTAFVKSPVQKYSVPFHIDPGTGATVDQYDYSLVRYVARRLGSPLDGWKYEITKARHPHERFRHVGRNSPCPCDSGRKYKKCCLNEVGVLRPHYAFEFVVPPPAELMGIEYSQDRRANR